jgi:hypothetical protein
VIKLERTIATGVVEIDISTVIAGEFGKFPHGKSYVGVFAFYVIVFSVIVLGAVVSARMYAGLSPFWGLTAP